MSFTYEPTTDIGRVRRTLPDRNEDEALFTNEEIQSYLDDESGNWRLATALMLETIASDIAMVMQVMKVQNITTDASKASAELLKRAALLRGQAAVLVEAAVAGSDFEIVEIVTDDFGYRQHLWNERARSL